MRLKLCMLLPIRRCYEMKRSPWEMLCLFYIEESLLKHKCIGDSPIQCKFGFEWCPGFIILGRIFMKDTCKLKLELPVQGKLFHRCPKRMGAKLGFEGLNPGRLIPGSLGRWRLAIDEGLQIVNCRTISGWWLLKYNNWLLRRWSRRRRRIISYCYHFHSEFIGFYSNCVEGIAGNVKVDEVMMVRVKEKKLATQARPKDTTQSLSCRAIGAL